MAQAAVRAAATLKEQLVKAQTGHFTNTFSRGKLVVSNSGGGQSGSFEIGVQGKEWTQDNIFGLIEELIQMVDARVAGGTPDSSDPTLAAAMRDGMIADICAGLFPQSGVREQLGDFSGLNFPATAIGLAP